MKFSKLNLRQSSSDSVISENFEKDQTIDPCISSNEDLQYNKIDIIKNFRFLNVDTRLSDAKRINNYNWKNMSKNILCQAKDDHKADYIKRTFGNMPKSLDINMYSVNKKLIENSRNPKNIFLSQICKKEGLRLSKSVEDELKGKKNLENIHSINHISLRRKSCDCKNCGLLSKKEKILGCFYPLGKINEHQRILEKKYIDVKLKDRISKFNLLLEKNKKLRTDQSNDNSK